MALDLSLAFRDIVNGTDLGTVTKYASLDWQERINGQGDQAATFSAGIYDATIAAAVTAALAATGNVRATISLNGTPVAVFMVLALSFQHLPAILTVNGTDLITLYDGVPVDRLKAVNTTISQAATAVMGGAQPGIDNWADYAELVFTAHVAHGGTTPLTEDINSMSALQAIEQLAGVLGGRLGPEYGAYYADSVNRVMYLGQTAGGSVGTLTDVAIDSLVEATDVTGTASQFQIAGGPSLWGLPQGIIITGVFAIPGAGGVADVQFMVTGYSGDTIGGAYYVTPEGLCHPFSQNVGVYAAWFDAVRSILYLSTASGIYERYVYQGPGVFKLTTGDYVGVPNTQQHTPFTLRTTDVIVDGIQVYAHASGNTSGDAVYTYPYLFGFGDGSTPPIGGGADYWKALPVGDIVCMTALNSTLYYVLAENPTVIHAWRHIGDPFLFDFRTPVIDTISVPGAPAYAVTKLCPVVAGGALAVFVLTQGGTDGLCVILDGQSVAKPVSASGTLTPTMINNVVGGGPNATTVMALTNDGIWASNSAPGSRMTWRSLSPSGGLAGRQVLYAVAGDARSSPDGKHTAMLASDGNTIYDSQSDGQFWRDMLAESVNVDTALRNEADPSPLVPIVVIDGEGENVTHLLNPLPPFAPGAALRYLDAPSLAATTNYSHETISGVLLRDVVDFSARANQPQIQVQVSGTVIDESSAYLAAKPLTKVTIDYTGPGCTIGTAPDEVEYAPYNATLTVLERHFTAASGVLSCDLTLATLPITRRPDFTPQDSQFSLSRALRKP